MNATYSPQTAAEARSNYRDVTARLGLLGLDTAIPESVRTLAENTVDQTREACDPSTDAFAASVAAFEKSFDAAGQGAAAFNRKIIDISRRNFSSSFDLAKSLVGAKSLADMVELHAVYWRKQIDVLAGQAEEVRALSTKVTTEASEAIKTYKSGADTVRRSH
jgi:phasin